jgi:hypothetical protein
LDRPRAKIFNPNPKKIHPNPKIMQKKKGFYPNPKNPTRWLGQPGLRPNEKKKQFYLTLSNPADEQVNIESR